jgi:putative FmdB family regulatory protein
MPFYDYKCTKCGRVFEIQKGMNEKFDPLCPECKVVTQRIFNIPGTIRSEQNGACSTCASGVCSTCGVNK